MSCKIQFPLHHIEIQAKVFLKLFIIASAVYTLASCNSKKSTTNSQAAKLLQLGDSAIIAGNWEKGKQLIIRTRSMISDTDPLIVNYYCFASGFTADSTTLYADSALAFFKTERLKNQHPAEYQHALITKGDACVRTKKYILAFDYYYQAKKALPGGNCDNGSLAQKIGDIYYFQRNFAGASQYWGLSYRQFVACNTINIPQSALYEKFSRVNNIGFAFYKLGDLDSASYYYQTNLRLINEAKKNKLISKYITDAEYIITYDNLGGVHLKRGNLVLAQSYLRKATTIPIANIDGMLIPPYVKLGELYLKKGELTEAGEVLAKSKALLDLYAKDNRESQLKWYTLYAEYLFDIKNPTEAYRASNRYIALKDSLDNSMNELYRLDVSREFYTINQQYSLTELQQQDKLKMLYLVGVATALVLFFVIMLLIKRDLVRTKKSHAEATLHNQQLQLTLDELERGNKNYIRIMRVMAHDIINPLSGITGIASVLMINNAFTEYDRHMLKLIESTGLHSMEMINELLKWGLSNDDEQMQTELVNLRALMSDSVELLRFKANEKDQQIIFEFHEEQVMAEINHEKMWRVFNNLIVNAIKFSHNSSVINVSVKPQNGNILVAVADNGVGIPDKDKETVFEMFTSAKKAGTNGEQPFGLGLSISKRIVEMHNGKIWFESQAGKETTFYIQLPSVN